MFKAVLVFALLAFTSSDALFIKSKLRRALVDLVSPPQLPGIPILGNLLPSLGAVIGGMPASASGGGSAVEAGTGNAAAMKVEETPATHKIEEITSEHRIIRSYLGPQFYSYVPVNAYALPYAYSVPYSIPRSLYQVRSGWQ